MQEKLQSLFKNDRRVSNDASWVLSDGQKYFLYLLKKYLCDYPYMQKINSVLLQLDSNKVRRSKPEERKDKLLEILQEERL